MNDDHKSVEPLLKLSQLLNEDVNWAQRQLQESNDTNGFYARSYVRALTSWIEGMIWLHKESLRKLEFQWHKELPLECQLYLFERDWNLNSTCKPVLKKKKLGAKENLKAFFYVMGQLFHGYSERTVGEGWESIIKLYDIRDKIVHPSNVLDLEISIDDLEVCKKAEYWFRDEMGEFTKYVLKRLDIS